MTTKLSIFCIITIIFSLIVSSMPMPMLLKYKSSPGLTPRATHSQFAYEKRHILKRECSIISSLIY